MIIAIGGVSNAGKTHLAEKLADHFQQLNTKIISQDDYVLPANEIPQIIDHIDWETPESVNFNSFRQAIIEADKNYDFVIVEGIFVFFDKAINELYDKKIFIEISRDTFLQRKIKDDRWGIEPAWYMDHIWNSYLKFGQPKKKMKDIYYVDGNREIILSDILQFLSSRLSH